jgi:hypothetical protein
VLITRECVGKSNLERSPHEATVEVRGKINIGHLIARDVSVTRSIFDVAMTRSIFGCNFLAHGDCIGGGGFNRGFNGGNNIYADGDRRSAKNG